MTGMYGLPLDVQFCSRCVISNQRPSSVVERLARPDDAKPTIAFKDGVCSACLYAERKKTIDWAARERQLVALLDKHRQRAGHNVVVPGSGGKDSCYAAHLLKHRYGMRPITATASPLLYTEIGRKNYEAFNRICPNVFYEFEDAGKRTREAFLEFLHPFKPFIEEQRAVGPRVSKMTGIPLVMYGEPPAERGGNEHELDSPIMDPKYYPDAAPDTEVHYLGWYLPWNSMSNFYYAVEHCGFQPNTERTQGTYSKLSSLDDEVDFLHYLTGFAKFGIGRATYNACEDIRDGHISRDEGVALVRRYDGEWPDKHLPQCLEFMGLTEAEFTDRLDAGRSPHLWDRVDGQWTLKHPIT